jgi:UDP-3-O-[3-hydroxymyristoyl] glucosamine N-acyltransferase
VRKVALGKLAELLGGELSGDPEHEVSGVAPLDVARQDQVSFLSSAKYALSLGTTKAGAVIVSREDDAPGLNLIRVDDPYLGFAMAMEVFYRDPYSASGISELASVHQEAIIGEEVSIHPFVVVSERARIGDRVTLMPGVFVGPGAEVGEDSVLRSNVVLEWGVRVGARVIVHAGTVIGSDGYGFAKEGDVYRKIYHAGTVRVEDDVEIGAGCCIDRAVMGETLIGAGSKLDNLVHVAHNVRIGNNCALAGQVGLAGSVVLDDGVSMGGQSGVGGHLKVGRDCVILGKSGVTKELPDGSRVAGFPAMESGQWWRTTALLGKLDDLRRRVARLESGQKRAPDNDKEEGCD